MRPPYVHAISAKTARRCPAPQPVLTCAKRRAMEQLNVALQPIIVDQGRVRQAQVTAEQHDMDASLGVQVDLGQDDDMQRLLELI